MDILRTLAAALAITIFTGCTKEEPCITSDGPFTTTPQKTGAGGKVYPQFYDLQATGIVGCFNEGGNCLPELVVSRSITQEMDRIWEDVLSGDKDRIANAFQTHSGTLERLLQAEHLNGVMNGTLGASGTPALPGASPERYLKIHSDHGIIAVYPLRSSIR